MALPLYATPAAMLEAMIAATAAAPLVRNFAGTIEDMGGDAIVVESELFPREALDFYTRHNLNELHRVEDEQQLGAPGHVDEHAAAYQRWYNGARGGGQGDYRAGIVPKIANVVACLTAFPHSKRAVLTVPNAPALDHTVDEDAKCLRELHFYVDEDGKLSCSGFMRAQAASIFPKNIHFIGTIQQRVAEALGRPVGSYTHFVTQLTSGR